MNVSFEFRSLALRSPPKSFYLDYLDDESTLSADEQMDVADKERDAETIFSNNCDVQATPTLADIARNEHSCLPSFSESFNTHFSNKDNFYEYIKKCSEARNEPMPELLQTNRSRTDFNNINPLDTLPRSNQLIEESSSMLPPPIISIRSLNFNDKSNDPRYEDGLKKTMDHPFDSLKSDTLDTIRESVVFKIPNPAKKRKNIVIENNETVHSSPISDEPGAKNSVNILTNNTSDRLDSQFVNYYSGFEFDNHIDQAAMQNAIRSESKEKQLNDPNNTEMKQTINQREAISQNVKGIVERQDELCRLRKTNCKRKTIAKPRKRTAEASSSSLNQQFTNFREQVDTLDISNNDAGNSDTWLERVFNTQTLKQEFILSEDARDLKQDTSTEQIQIPDTEKVINQSINESASNLSDTVEQVTESTEHSYPEKRSFSKHPFCDAAKMDVEADKHEVRKYLEVVSHSGDFQPLERVNKFQNNIGNAETEVKAPTPRQSNEKMAMVTNNFDVFKHPVLTQHLLSEGRKIPNTRENNIANYKEWNKFNEMHLPTTTSNQMDHRLHATQKVDQNIAFFSSLELQKLWNTTENVQTYCSKDRELTKHSPKFDFQNTTCNIPNKNTRLSETSTIPVSNSNSYFDNVIRDNESLAMKKFDFVDQNIMVLESLETQNLQNNTEKNVQTDCSNFKVIKGQTRFQTLKFDLPKSTTNIQDGKALSSLEENSIQVCKSNSATDDVTTHTSSQALKQVNLEQQDIMSYTQKLVEFNQLRYLNAAINLPNNTSRPVAEFKKVVLQEETSPVVSKPRSPYSSKNLKTEGLVLQKGPTIADSLVTDTIENNSLQSCILSDVNNLKHEEFPPTPGSKNLILEQQYDDTKQTAVLNGIHDIHEGKDEFGLGIFKNNAGTLKSFHENVNNASDNNLLSRPHVSVKKVIIDPSRLGNEASNVKILNKIEARFYCCYCMKWLKTINGIENHLREVHFVKDPKYNDHFKFFGKHNETWKEMNLNKTVTVLRQNKNNSQLEKMFGVSKSQTAAIKMNLETKTVPDIRLNKNSGELGRTLDESKSQTSAIKMNLEAKTVPDIRLNKNTGELGRTLDESNSQTSAIKMNLEAKIVPGGHLNVCEIAQSTEEAKSQIPNIEMLHSTLPSVHITGVNSYLCVDCHVSFKSFSTALDHANEKHAGYFYTIKITE